MAVLGTLILAVGWFGFNAGWAFLGSDLRLSLVAVNTLLSSVAWRGLGDGHAAGQTDEARPHDDV